MATKKAKKEKIITPYWQQIVDCWFDFCYQHFNERPTFDGSAPIDLKNIIKALQDRATTSNIEWTLETALSRFKNFLSYAIQDDWLRKNFLLFNINRQKDKIFFNIKSFFNKNQYYE